MSINKEKRQAVYAKYDGHCAYCGREIEYKDMQVDHFIPQNMDYVFVMGDVPGVANVDDLKNLMPACRMCNHYKRAHSLETFRRYIEEIPRKLRADYIYKIGVLYGNVVENEKPIKFYFETEDEGRDVKEKKPWEQLGYDFDPPFYASTSIPIVTNYDRLISKTPEEMAEFLTLIMRGEEPHVPFLCATVDKWLNWLRQEAPDEPPN